jgi:DNA-binding transcriptional LysR family regulator
MTAAPPAEDANDLVLFTQVVDHGGFAAAARATGVPKSRLSRRVAQLEDRLGVRLIQRSSRRFAVTEIGRQFHARCQIVAAEVEAAHGIVARAIAEPQGVVHVTCPYNLADRWLGPMLPPFLKSHPKVRLVLEVTNRRVDVIGEGIDVALRAQRPPLEDTGLVLRHLGEVRRILVASPALVPHPLSSPHDLARYPAVGPAQVGEDLVWSLSGPDGAQLELRQRPVLATGENIVLKQAAIAGLGVALLAETLCRDSLADGSLLQLLPEWTHPIGLIHALFASRRGLVPAVRSFIDHVAEQARRWAPPGTSQHQDAASELDRLPP